MTDAEYERTKRRVRKIANKWIGMVGLGTWNVDLVYERAGIRSKSKEGDDADRRVAMNVTTRWEYQQAAVSIDMLECFGMTDATLEETFVHELAHVLVNEMREFGRAPDDLAPRNCTVHEERVATMIANALIWTDRHMTVPVVALARLREKRR